MLSLSALAHHHAVQFYGNDNSLFTTVSGFLGQGLVDGNPGIIIATASHGKAILDRLKARLIDIDRAQRTGQLVVLDAHKTLDRFMVGDLPDTEAFEESVGRLIAGLVNGHSERTLIRAYGEMVDVLWKQGRIEATIRLEMLWNKLAGQYGIALLCGYAVGNFAQTPAAFEEVCRQHTHVVPADAPMGSRAVVRILP
jgi:MEDS: MEthanogen/methylotroph, DcmR Sensory domain